ncbi:MAG TPA: hypothetical protein PLV91_06520 [Verrucomicrobiota bacterium]|nr:hypothetical protein [Verrucomicrobiota bacterium]
MNLIVVSVACALVLAFSSACSKEESSSSGVPTVTEAQKNELQKAAEKSGAAMEKAATDASKAANQAADKAAETAAGAADAVKEATTPAK